MNDKPTVNPAHPVTRWERLPLPVRQVMVRSRRLSHLSRRPNPRVTVQITDGVGLITYDDGKVNAISSRAAALLSQAHARVTSDQTLKAVVLAGRAGQFSAGFDLDTLMIGGPARRELFRTGWDMLMRYHTLQVPLVVACTGNAVAAGAALLLGGDVRLAAQGSYTIGFNEARIGLPLPGLLLMLARDKLAADAFDEATAGARMYSPDEAVAAGFVDRVVPAVDLLPAARAEAARLGNLPPQSLRNLRGTSVQERTARIERQLQADLELMEHLGV